jgi:hypothetical protein
MECKELAGKVIRACNLYEGAVDGPELQIDFTDDTSFAVSLRAQVSFEAKCVQNDGGEPKVLKDYTASSISR